MEAFAGLIGIVSGCVAAWAFVLEMKVYFATNRKLPEEFQDGRYAVYDDFALSPLTPLAVQADYIKAGFILCAALLGFSACAFLLENAVVGWIFLAVFLVGATTAIKNTRTYRTNCIERTKHDIKEET